MPLPVIRVLIVDDSLFVRNVLQSALANHPRIEVVGTAVDGVEALRKLATLRPDVVTLDVEMPRLDGIGVLERAADKVPVSFIMVSTLTRAGAAVTFEALDKGAFDYIEKPQSGGIAGVPGFRKSLVDKILAAAAARGKSRGLRRAARTTAPSRPSLPPNQVRGWVVAIGISCGGPQTLHRMLPAFPSDFVPILITQHMPAEFTRAFADNLDRACAAHVCEATHGQRVEHGHIYVAPGSHHLRLERRGVQLHVRLDDGAKVSGHRPSADVMLTSVAEVCGSRSVGVIMTGMGADGAQGMRALRAAGAATLAQDEATSLVYGMPKAAYETGCVDSVAGLAELPFAIARAIRSDSSRALAR